KDYVKNNYIRYFIIPENSLHTFQGHGPTPESLPLEMTNWIIENGKIIPQNEYLADIDSNFLGPLGNPVIIDMKK
ncbi:MAG: hypothetical protein KAT05_16070, partial [Spirochaetes bacterium]|nr:hypothetical protein [Spirochaetota bacterium]